MTTFDLSDLHGFSARLERAARDIDARGEKVAEVHGQILADVIDKVAPRRTRDSTPSAEQVRPGVVQPSTYLVGELVGSAGNAPRSDRFLLDALEEVEVDYLNDIRELALRLTGG